MIKVITNLELDVLKETLENSFVLAKEMDDLELMVDLGTCMSLIHKLRKCDVERELG